MIDKASEDHIKLCSMCGRDLLPGGTRRIGICVWCVADSARGKGQRVPTMKYQRGTDDHDSVSKRDG